MFKYLRWQLLIAAAGLCLIVALIITAASPTSTAIVPEAGGTYIEGAIGQPKFLNPILRQLDTVDDDIVSLVFQGLTKVGDDGQIMPGLAERWEISPDGRVYTFYLRPGVRWHDGQPFGADDVVFTIKAIQDIDFQGNRALAGLWRDVTVQQIDEATVRFVLKDAYAPFLEFTTIGILPAHILANVPAKRLPDSAFNAKPVGTGPYKVKAASLQEVVLEANKDYYGRRPLLSRIRFRFYPDDKKALIALQRDEIQGVGRLNPAEVRVLEGDKQFNTYALPEMSKLTLLILNTKSSIFGEKGVRQAVAYGIDRQKLINLVLDGRGTQADSPISPASWAYKYDVKRYDYKPDYARKLLDDLGWRDTDGDGIRDKGGQKLRFVILTNDNPLRIKVAEELGRQLKDIGMQVEVHAAGWSGVVQDFLIPRNFQSVLTEEWSPNADPDCYQFWHSSQIKEGLNFSSWTNRRADEVLENARRSSSQTERLKLYQEFQSIFADEEPGILLYYPVYNYVINKNVKGIHLGPLIMDSDRFKNIDQWYVRSPYTVSDGGEIPKPR
ncbi:MAG: ABC transporter substrate-binding protein [Chloroflexi bacterium]|nr:ABC transporter substrate-binding protein [Chloroflexota bacterium]MCL5074715.1 ABC transporter substrate-binding protein [Chloroflexota bacterium]